MSNYFDQVSGQIVKRAIMKAVGLHIVLGSYPRDYSTTDFLES